MMQRNNVLRVNEAEEQAAYVDAIAEILRNIQSDHKVTLLDISKETGISLGTVSNAANKKCSLTPVFLKRLGLVYGPHSLDPFAKLAGGRVVPRENPEGDDILPVMTMASARIAAARAPSSPGGVSETLNEQLGYLPELRRLQREVGALIRRVEERKDAA